MLYQASETLKSEKLECKLQLYSFQDMLLDLSGAQVPHREKKVYIPTPPRYSSEVKIIYSV